MKLVLVLFAALGVAFNAHGADSVTATKSTSSTSGATFSIATAQTIEWSATWTGSSGDGNGFYLHQPGQPLNDIPLSTSLTSGFNTGTHFLSAGTYNISINYFGMGPGTYTIVYNKTASITVSPSSHSFGSEIEGEETATKSFSISSTGDLPVTINSVTSSDPSRFPIVSSAAGQVTPPSRTFIVKFRAQPPVGPHSATITISGTASGVTVSPITVSVTGTTDPKEPDVTCAGGSGHLGSADWFISEEKVFTYQFHNDGSDPLLLSSVTLVNDSSGNAFSLDTPVSLASIPAGGSRPAQIRFAPPFSGGEATYSAHLVITSNDPDEPVKNCSFSATAHHPAPIMRLESALLDYREVELGFSFTKAIIVYNDGDLPLNVTIEDVSTGDPLYEPHLVQWSSLDLSSATVAPSGAPAVFQQVYTPNAIAEHTIRLRASSNSFVNPEQDVTLTGEGIAPVPIDSVLVLDRSGSMDDPAGAWGRKIDALRVAADLYTHLLRAEIPGTSAGDQIGFVRYNHTNDIYLPLNFVEAAASPGTHLAAAEDALSPSAVNDTTRLGPLGNTGIGGAMETAAGILASSSAERKHVMVVLTDGIENTPPYILSVKDDIQNADPNLMMYSIGLGSTIEPAKLQAISNGGPEGYHQVATSLAETAIFDLEMFYFKIFANATGMELVVDPTHPVYINSTDPIIVDRAHVVSSDRYAVFLVLDVEELRMFYDLEFVDPKGNVIVPGSGVGGTPVHVFQRHNYTIYRVVFPDVALASDYVGDWTLRLQPNGRWSPQIVKRLLHKYGGQALAAGSTNAYQGLVPIGFAAAVGSDYKLAVELVPTSFLPGAQVAMTARLTDRGWPSIGGLVRVTITRPDGTEYPGVPLFDDGTHGDEEAADGVWTNVFTHTGMSGTYEFYFKAFGKNERGELVPREAKRYVALTPPPRNPSDRPDRLTDRELCDLIRRCLKETLSKERVPQ